MVDSINIPRDLGKVIEVSVKYKPETLVKFLTDIAIRIENLEQANQDLENRVTELEGP